MAQTAQSKRPPMPLRALAAMAILLALPLAGATTAMAQRLTEDAAARLVAETYGVEPLRVERMLLDDNRLAYAITVMTPGGNSNNAFMVTTLVVDARTGELVPQFRHTPTGHEISGAPSNVPPTKSDGPALRRGANRP